jgi:polygalacturonase
VRDVAYQDICMRDVKNPVLMDPFYTRTAKGAMAPIYQDLLLKNVHVGGGGRVTLLGLDGQHLLTMQLAGVVVDGLEPGDLRAAYARLVFGPGPVSFAPTGDDVQVAKIAAGEKGEAPSCGGRFVPFPDGNKLFPLQRSASASSRATAPASVTVAADGSGDYKSVQEGIALGSDGGSVRVKPGVYREVLRIATPHVRVEGLGDDPAKVVVVYGNAASITGSTFTSATVFVTGDDFYATNVTFQNDFSRTHESQPQGSQAVALSVTADRAIFRNVRFLHAHTPVFSGLLCRGPRGFHLR